MRTISNIHIFKFASADLIYLCTFAGLSSAPLDPNPRMDIAIPMPNPFQLHGGKVDEGMEGLQTKDVRAQENKYNNHSNKVVVS